MLQRIKRMFFPTWTFSVMTVVFGVLAVWAAARIVDWALINAVWTVPGEGTAVDTSACRAVEGRGACWAVIAEKYRLILFGLYPYAEQWRAAIAVALFIALFAVSAAVPEGWRRILAAIWIAVLGAIGVLMWGGVLGLRYVPEDQWGGLPVSLILATFGLALAFPLAVAVALGRLSTRLAGVRALCLAYVELIRGVPLISVLFMASVMFPLFLPDGVNVSKLLRAQIGIVLFEAAYLSEIVRGSLLAIPAGQTEAAVALGLGYWRRTFLILLPQALRMALPSLANAFIGFLKATSLVTVIGVFDLLTAAKRSVGEPAWEGFGTEAYLFVAAVFFAFCAAIARYSRRLELRLADRAGR